jgi:hypothetical protein
MLLKHHVNYSIPVIGGLIADSLIKEQVKIGATANDLCEFTNEGQILVPSKEAAFDLFGSRERVFGNLAVYQSNFGNLASMHAMSKKPGEPVSTTKKELVAWFEFLNDVALGSITIVPDRKIASDNVQIRNMFTGGSIEYDQIFDTKETLKIKYRAIGMMLHLIQDAYTFSHCERNDKNEVVRFYCYELQNRAKHTSGDDVQDAQKNTLLNQCKICIESILNGGRYNYNQILSLSSNAQNSSGGNFA